MKLSKFLLPLLLLTGCASNPFNTAKTVEQKSYALYGTFVIVEEQAAVLMGYADVPASVKRAMQRADARAKPAADELKKAVDAYSRVRIGLEGSPDDARYAAENLSRVYMETRPIIVCLITIVRGGDTSCSN